MILALLCGGGYPAWGEAPGELRAAVRRGDAAELARLLAAAPPDRREADAATSLIWSAYDGRTDLLSALLTHGVPATAADARGWTALMAAVKGNQPEAVDILLKHGADGDARPRDGGSSARMLATELGRMEIIERLRRRSGAPTSKDARETLASAVQNGRLDMIRTLLADPAFRVSGPVGQRALLLAIQQQDTATALALLDGGASATEPVDDQGTTPLLATSHTTNADLLGTLLGRGADPNLADSQGRTALRVSIMPGAEKTVRLLLTHGARPTLRDMLDNGPLFGAISCHLTSLVEPLLAAGLDVNQPGLDGKTPLMWAVARNPDAVDALLARHARLDLCDHDARTVFDLPGGSALADKLRRAGKGVEVDAVLAMPHRSPAQLSVDLQAAVKQGDADTVKTLLDHGANPETYNKLGWPVFVLAASKGHTEVLRVLYQRNYETLYQDAPDGWNALMEAAGNGHLETVRFLLERHAQPRLSNNRQSTPRDYAMQRGYQEVAQVLGEAEARSPATPPTLPPMP